MTPFEEAELKTDLLVNSTLMGQFERPRDKRRDTIKKGCYANRE
jgi:hypothetical protein